MIALIDGDSIAYRCAASCEPTLKKPERESLDQALLRADELMYRICNTCESQEYRVFLGGSENFRKILCPDYKANREKLRRPEYLDRVREFLLSEWSGEICTGYEADDGIGIAASENSIVVSNDKDFRQIPGQHYNFVKDVFESISPDEAALAFWSSMLIGDPSDNIKGVDGIGTVRAKRILGNCDPAEMDSVVLQYYGNRDRFLLNYRLLRILRSEQEWREVEDQLREGKGPASTEEGEG